MTTAKEAPRRKACGIKKHARELKKLKPRYFEGEDPAYCQDLLALVKREMKVDRQRTEEVVIQNVAVKEASDKRLDFRMTVPNFISASVGSTLFMLSERTGLKHEVRVLKKFNN